MLPKSRHFVMLLLLFISCSKSDPVSYKKSMLHGFSAGAQTWRLTILSINGQQQPLDPTLSKFEKTFYADGKYTDTDATEGTWNMDSDSQLTEVYTNLSTGPLTQTYTILNLTAKTLITRYTSNGDQIVTQFDAVK